MPQDCKYKGISILVCASIASFKHCYHSYWQYVRISPRWYVYASMSTRLFVIRGGVTHCRSHATQQCPSVHYWQCLHVHTWIPINLKTAPPVRCLGYCCCLHALPRGHCRCQSVLANCIVNDVYTSNARRMDGNSNSSWQYYRVRDSGHVPTDSTEWTLTITSILADCDCYLSFRRPSHTQ